MIFISAFFAVGCAVLVPSGVVYGQALHDAHKKAGIECAMCHAQAPPRKAAPNATCVGCHGTMLDIKDAPLPNPHVSPHLGPGEIPACGECHKVHRPSEVTCVRCHRGFKFDIK